MTHHVEVNFYGEHKATIHFGKQRISLLGLKVLEVLKKIILERILNVSTLKYTVFLTILSNNNRELPIIVECHFLNLKRI